MTTPPTLDDVVVFLRAKYCAASSDRAAVAPTTTRVVEALRAYEDALARRPLFELARQIGMPWNTAAVRSPDEAALELLLTVEALPELASGRGSHRLPVVDQELPEWPRNADGTIVVKPRFAHLYERLLLEERLVIIGGTAVPEKLAWCREAVMTPDAEYVEWISIEGHDDTRVAQRLVNRMKSCTIAGVIYLVELMGHDQTRLLQEAGRECALPVFPGAKGGQGALLTALAQIDTWYDNAGKEG